MIITKQELEEKDKIERLNLINSITGIKPANLIGTIDPKSKETNLGIFSSVVHLGSYPALLGFVMRPNTEVRRHTYENMINNDGYYTINHVHPKYLEQSHYTSAKFAKNESEFDYCGFTEEYIAAFKAPFVKESLIKIGMKFQEEISIKANGTVLIIGEVELIDVPKNIIDSKGQIDLSSSSIGISGLNRYYELTKVAEFPYARREDVPELRK